MRGLVRATSDGDTVAWLKSLGVELVPGDVTDPTCLAPLVEGADLVIHSAAVIGYRRRQWGTMAHVNVIGTRHVVEACLAADAVLLGAVGGPKWDDPNARVRPEQGLLGLRKLLGLYANLRPIKIWPSLLEASPLKADRLDGIDMLADVRAPLRFDG